MEKKIIGYLTVICGSMAFDKSVNARLKEGWEILGAPFVHNFNLVQAMVKYEYTLNEESK